MMVTSGMCVPATHHSKGKLAWPSNRWTVTPFNLQATHGSCNLQRPKLSSLPWPGGLCSDPVCPFTPTAAHTCLHAVKGCLEVADGGLAQGCKGLVGDGLVCKQVFSLAAAIIALLGRHL